jgi:hypothetical protein
MSWLITGTQKVNWTPANITTALWLDAADNATVFSDAGTTQAVAGTSTVQQWNDKSGNARHVSQATSAQRPDYASSQIGGKPALNWGSTENSKGLTRGSMNYSPVRYYGVAYYTGANPFTNYRGLVTHNFTQLNDLFMTDTSATSWYPPSIAFLNGALSSSSTALPTISSPFIFATDFSSSANRTDVYIGRDRDIAGRGWLGSIGEIIATPSVPSNDVKQKLEGYLAHKWSLTANLPAGHPYKNSPPVP